MLYNRDQSFAVTVVTGDALRSLLRSSTCLTGSPGLANGNVLITKSRPGKDDSRIPGSSDTPSTD